MTTQPEPYAARLEIDYPERLDRLTTAFRLLLGHPDRHHHRPAQRHRQ